MDQDGATRRFEIGRELTFAIGDVHGRADLLERLLARVEADGAEAGREPSVIFIGDIVDRGPDSRSAVELVVRTLRRWPSSRLCLGNHDKWFLQFLEDDPAFAPAMNSWLGQGGYETLVSYGRTAGPADRVRQSILSAHPEHLALLRQASLYEIDGDFLFVHAGIDPLRPLDAQGDDEFLWIRAPFLRHVGRLAHVVVHGHTPQEPPAPHVTENRIAIDTGAVHTGVLTALRIDAAAQSIGFLATGRRGEVAPIAPVVLDRGLGTVLDRRP